MLPTREWGPCTKDILAVLLGELEADEGTVNRIVTENTAIL